ncbi:hypothetical protein VUJ46_17210 [Chryseobacterium sp. MYb264]|uniref:hypothetical protein n=1 Tax=Chryseobacterium sp. MYb264 TaxID=2745153 RepID=UPI002E0D3AB5|nr:hypothetical protein VUJ46_17210 [Chryseobacterium sp. MYb264]
MQNPKDLAGNWLYRSFVNNANSDDDPKLFGEGILKIQQSDFGDIIADFDFGESVQMKVKGSVIRTEPHGQAKAGVVASFIMLKMN